MKGLNLVLLGLVLFLSASSQTQSDKELKSRLDEYIAYTKQMNFEKLMDYIHPSLFKIVPKDQLASGMRSAFENEMLKIDIDSFKILKISPDYNYEKTAYRKIDYFMSLNLGLKDSTLLRDNSQRAAFIEQIKDGFPGGTVEYVGGGNYLNIDTRKIMFGIKDPGIKWMFLGFEDRQREMMETLIPKTVLSYFKL